MPELLALAVIAVGVVFLLGTIALIGFVLKVLFWAVLFPIRLAFKVIFGLGGLVLGAVLVPIVLVVVAVAVIGALIAGVIALVTPLLPVILLGLVGWAIYRASSSSVRGYVGP
jgi:hypothetical protein